MVVWAHLEVIEQQPAAFVDGLRREQAPGGVELQRMAEQGVVEDDVPAQAVDVERLSGFLRHGRHPVG